MLTQVVIQGRTVSLSPIRRKLAEERSLDIGLLPEKVVADVLQAHLSQAGLTEIDAYASLLSRDEGEYQALLRDLLAPPERFFQDPQLTSLLGEEVLPAILARKEPRETLRVWIINSGQGYLVYDVALVLERLLLETREVRSVRVLAGFADHESANRARWRDYPPERLAELAEAWPIPGNVEHALRGVRSQIVFGVHDLVTQTPYANIDLAICAGYLPLLKPADRERVTAKLIHSLLVKGVLILGRGEIPLVETPPPSEERPFPIFTKHVVHPFELRRTVFPLSLTSAAVGLLDRFADPLLMVNTAGVIVAANHEAVESLSAGEALEETHLSKLEPPGLAEKLSQAAEEMTRPNALTAVIESDGWIGGVARVAGYAGGAAAAIALVPAEYCKTLARQAGRDQEDACRERAGKTAELSAEVWVREHQIRLLTRQASVITENLYKRNEQMASMQVELRARNEALETTNDQLRKAVSDRDNAQSQLQEAFEREHHIAETLQNALLPHIAERANGFSIAVKYRAAFEEAEVGGDFYHGGQLGPDRYLLALGDVSGKGLEAAVTGSMAKYMLIGFSGETADLAVAMVSLNDALAPRYNDYRFVTLACVLVDLRTKRVYYASAGHEPVIYYHHQTGETELLGPTGRALGIEEGAEYGTREIHMEPGDLMLAYTDGLSDAGVPDRPLGTDGLVRLVEEHASSAPQQILDIIHDTATEIAGGRLRDDAASVLLKRED